MTLDVTASDKAQHGAVVLNKIGSLTHRPDRPGDMDEAFYKLAYAGCRESNLHQGQPNPVERRPRLHGRFGRVEHRRGGTPAVGALPDAPAVGLRARQRLRRDARDRELGGGAALPVFRLPVRGYYPLDLIGAHYAWSIHIHSSQIQRPAASEVKVSVSVLDEHFRTGRELETKVVGIIPDSPQTPDRPMHVIVFRPEFKAGAAGGQVPGAGGGIARAER